MFMDYPPVPALVPKGGVRGDYLNNFTICRWSQVLGGLGVRTPSAYETIVDSRPIAARGSNEEPLMPDPPTWFNSGKGAVYLTPMIELLASTGVDGGPATRPVAIFGGTPRKTWGTMVGSSKSIAVLDVGTTQLGGQTRSTPWIATNHPDVTTYNCCANDSSSRCAADSRKLLDSEKTDFVAACWLQTMARHADESPDGAKQSCEAKWSTQPTPGARQALCVQAKRDNNNPAAACESTKTRGTTAPPTTPTPALRWTAITTRPRSRRRCRPWRSDPSAGTRAAGSCSDCIDRPDTRIRALPAGSPLEF